MNNPKSTATQDTFEWIGVNARGKKLEGELSGQSIALVKAQLRKQGITPSKVKRKAKPLFGIKSVQKITPKDISLIYSADCNHVDGGCTTDTNY